MDADQITPAVERKRAAQHIQAMSGMVPFLCTMFLCINTYAQQSNSTVSYALNDIPDSAVALKTDTTGSAGTTMKNYLLEQRDVYDVLRMLFGLDITPSDTVSQEKGTLYVAAIPG